MIPPTTRRELRLAERRGARGRWNPLRVVGRPARGRRVAPRAAGHGVVAARRSSRTRRGGGRHTDAPQRSPLLVPVAATVLSAMLLAGAVDHVQTRRADHAAELAYQVAVDAAAAAHAQQERSDRAQTARLTGHAAAYAAGLLDQALTRARDTVRAADVVAASAEPVVDATTLSPLDTAVAELAASIEHSPDPATVRTTGGSVHRSGARAELVPEGLAARERLLAGVETVSALSVQVQAVADANIAAAQSAARAAAAAEAIVADLAARIALAAGSPNGEIPTAALCGVGFSDGVRLRCDAAVALEQLNTAYRAAFGSDLDVQSSYRDYAAQVATRQLRGSLAGVPGTSNHGLGLAVDLGGLGSLGEFDAPRYLWMKKHAPAYGWHHPSYMEPGGSGPLEPWHWEYGTL